MVKITKKELESKLNDLVYQLLTAENAEHCLIYLKYYPQVYSGDIQPFESGMSLRDLLDTQEILVKFFRLVSIASLQSDHVGPVMNLTNLQLAKEVELPKMFFDIAHSRISKAGANRLDWVKVMT